MLTNVDALQRNDISFPLFSEDRFVSGFVLLAPFNLSCEIYLCEISRPACSRDRYRELYKLLHSLLIRQYRRSRSRYAS